MALSLPFAGLKRLVAGDSSTPGEAARKAAAGSIASPRPAAETNYVPDSELAQFNVQSAKSRLRVWSLFVAVFGTASLMTAEPEATLGVSMGALVLPGIAAVLSCLAVIYLPIASRHPWPTFYAQMVIGLVTLSICIHVGASDDMAVAARLLFVLIFVPPHLVSQQAGTVATIACIVAHLVLAFAEDGLSWHTAGAGGTLGPVVAMVLVAMMARAHAGYIGTTTAQLRNLAAHLDQSRRRLGRLVDVAKALNESTDMQSLFDRVNSAVRREFRADWCATYRADRERGFFELAAASDRTTGRTARLRIDDWPLLHRLARTGVIFLERDESDRFVRALDMPPSIGTVVLAALSRGSEMQGVLVLGYRGERPHFSEGDLAQIAAVTEHATVVLQKARLLDDERELSAMKSEFLSTMSHELRTPINIILGYIEILRDPETGDLNQAQGELFASIERQARELNDLIESVLQVGRIESGRDRIVVAPVEFGRLAATIAAAVENLPRREGVRLIWSGGDRIHGTLETDASRVALVVRNLVGNALKFTLHGSVSIHFARDGGDLSIEVADTGPGIPAASLPTIFDMFRQVGNESGERARGVGFGLYIVDQTVRRLGGQVEVSSEVGKGTSFRMRIPGFAGVELKESA